MKNKESPLKILNLKNSFPYTKIIFSLYQKKKRYFLFPPFSSLLFSKHPHM